MWHVRAVDRAISIASVVAFTLSLAAPASGQPSSWLTASVNDGIDRPLEGVTIAIRGPTRSVGHTGPDGRFSFGPLPEGLYEVTAALAGFQTTSRTIFLATTEQSVVELRLAIQVVEHTVITATKTGDTDVQATPMAVSVLGRSELTRLEHHTVADIAGLAPLVTFSQNTGFAQLTIRGIGTNAVLAGSDPSSAVYVDGVYLARPVMVLADLLDIERIEVLRGPQGTLYGRNAVGGALNLITRPPTGESEASARIVFGSYGTRRAEMRVGGPIMAAKLMGSAALVRGVRRGYVRDLQHRGSALGGEDVTAARGQLRLVFTPRSELLVSADVTHEDSPPLTYAKVLMVKPGFAVNNPDDFYDVRASTAAYARNLHLGGLARVSVDLSPTTRLTSVSAYRELDYDRLVDTDITELELNATHIHEIQHQVSEEATVSHRRDRLTSVAGVFFFEEVDRQPTIIRMAGANRETLLNPRVHSHSAALFGQTTVHLTRPISATAGLRYTRERKAIDNAGHMLTLDTPSALVPASGYVYTDAISHAAWTPKFGVELRPDERVLAYASATRGFKSGGFNLTSMETGRGYAPEWAWSYEVGLKTVAKGGNAHVNVAAFHTQYTNLQVQTGIRPGLIDVSNAAAATNRGIEIEAVAAPGRSARVGGHLAWLDAGYDRYIATGTGGITADVAGRRLNNAPEWSGRLWLEWLLRVTAATSISLRADSTWQTTVFFTPFNDAIQQQAAYALLGGSAEFRPLYRRWSLAVYARNLTNEHYVTGTFGTAAPAIGGRPGVPRQIGIQFAVRR
jgi:iron complex outermembrane recepter protein